MTKVQLMALLVAGGLGATAATVVSNFSSDPVVFTHALRIEAGKTEDGGLGSDNITAYQTHASPDSDGGMVFEDLGPAPCTADTKALRSWVSTCKGSTEIRFADSGIKIESFDLENIYVIELRSVPDSDGGIVAAEVYGSNGSAKCSLLKSVELISFVSSLQCNRTPVTSRSKIDPL